MLLYHILNVYVSYPLLRQGEHKT